MRRIDVNETAFLIDKNTNTTYQPIENGKLLPLCERINTYVTKNNSIAVIIQGYEGIPQNLVVNLILWILLFGLFIILRKKAWEYGRLALVTKRHERWTSVNTKPEFSTVPSDSSESLDATVKMEDKGLCMWIPAFLRLKDDAIQKKCGPDAVQYLSFQRHLLFYTAITGFLSLTIALPVNFLGNLKSPDTQQFGTSTISNISGESHTLWVHMLLSFGFLLIAVATMRHFSKGLRFEKDEQQSRTLMISRVPRQQCIKSVIMSHFREAYEVCEVKDIRFAYDIRKLHEMNQKGQEAADALHQCEMQLQRGGARPRLVPHPCGHLLCCCRDCGFEEVDSILYYSERIQRYKALCRQQRADTLSHPLGIVFVTFATENQAAFVLQHYRPSFRNPVSPVPSTQSRILKASHWTVKYAPSRDDICWENLSMKSVYWWCKAILVNGTVLTVLFFLTTPTYLLNLLNKLEYKRRFSELHITFFTHMAPSLIMWLVSAVLPLIVYYSDLLVGHWTKTSGHLSVMTKTYGLLILMVLILPSLGLTSISSLLNWIFPINGIKANGGIIQWECVFMPDNGAFFVNYVITSAFIGSALELIRLPELFVFGCRLLLARSPVEKTSVRKTVLWDFQFGTSYAWMLCVFAAVSTYSLLCPLIMPFGLLYLLFKHLVDRYNIYFVYAPSRIDKRVHKLAIFCMLNSVILLQVNIIVFLIIRLGVLHPLCLCALVSLMFSILLLVGRSLCGWFDKFSPVVIDQGSHSRFAEDDSPSLTLRVTATPSHSSVSSTTQPLAATIQGHSTSSQEATSAPAFLPDILHDSYHSTTPFTKPLANSNTRSKPPHSEIYNHNSSLLHPDHLHKGDDSDDDDGFGPATLANRIPPRFDEPMEYLDGPPEMEDDTIRTVTAIGLDGTLNMAFSIDSMSSCENDY